MKYILFEMLLLRTGKHQLLKFYVKVKYENNRNKVQEDFPHASSLKASYGPSSLCLCSKVPVSCQILETIFAYFLIFT